MSIENISGPSEMPVPMGVQKQMISLTEKAAERLKFLLAQKSPAPEAVYVSVNSKGCSGLSYDIQFLQNLADKPKFSDCVTQYGVTVVIDPKAALYIVGSVMDYKEDQMKSGFDFANPNEVARCGCGESFSVDPKLAEQAKSKS